MKHFSFEHIILVSSAMALMACASTTTPYMPLTDGRTGYSEQFIENDRARVSFAATSEDTARDYALLRAAELTESRGYSHFEIVYATTEDIARGGPRSGVGVGVGSGGYRGGTNVGVGHGFNLGGGGSGIVQHTIEIRMRQDAQSGGDIYSAASVIDNIGARRT